MTQTFKNSTLDAMTGLPLQTLLDQPIQRVQMDSRKVQPGDVFVAITCDASVDHIRTALQAGAGDRRSRAGSSPTGGECFG